MAEVPRIADLPAVIEPHLNGGKLISYDSRYLTKPGENYGSVMLAIKANVQKPSGEIEEIPLIAKLPPITNDMFWQMFQPERTCLTENAVYQYLSPALRALQLEEGVPEDQLFDGFSKYYGSRISLKPDAKKVDRDAVLVQENLQTSGFKPGVRTTMFNLEQSKLVLRETAKFHALPIALRLKKPKEYDAYIRPYFHKFNLNNGITPEAKQTMENDLHTDVSLATNNNENYANKLTQLIKGYDSFVSGPEHEDGLYTTIVHSDLWINNIMLKYDESGRPTKVKFVDFQISQYESLPHDIVFFLFSSVEVSVLENHMDELLRLYYDSFIDCLKSVNVATDKYSYENFMQEVHACAPNELYHSLFMTKIILADSKELPDDYKDINIDSISRNVGKKNVIEKTAAILRLAEKYKFL